MKHHPIPEAVKGVILYDASFTSIKRKSDSDNCVLRAIAVAKDVPIDKPGDLARDLGRKSGSGTERKISKKLIETFKMKEVFSQIGSLHGATPVKAISIREAISRFPKGRYIFKSRKHWFAVIDGCPVDSWDWFNEVREVADFDTGAIFNLIGWDHKIYKVWEC